MFGPLKGGRNVFRIPSAALGGRPLAPFFALAVATLPLLSACGRGEEELPPEIRPVRTTTIAINTADGSIALTGTVQAENEINQSFRIDGRLIERSVNVGDSVSAGQLIARLDSQNEETSLQSARAQLAAAQARVVEAATTSAGCATWSPRTPCRGRRSTRRKPTVRPRSRRSSRRRSQVTLADNRLSYTRLSSSTWPAS